MQANYRPSRYLIFRARVTAQLATIRCSIRNRASQERQKYNTLPMNSSQPRRILIAPRMWGAVWLFGRGRPALGATHSHAPRSTELLIPTQDLCSSRLLYATAGASGHDMPGHAECAARASAILDSLEANHLTGYHSSQIMELGGYAPADASILAPVHDRRYLAALQRASEAARDVAYSIVEPAPTYVTQTTYTDVLRAAGAVIALVDHVIAAASFHHQNKHDASGTPAAFALCRPPGHHAVPTGGMGFCLLNNVAVAARHAQHAHGLQRIAIVDFDVHHGNGTQDAFYADPSVLFISTHQSGSYPNTGKVDEVGAADGEGTTINVPLPGGAGHEAALAAYEEVIGPALSRFQPELLLVSAGYDAHWKDPLAGLQYRSTTYHALTQRLRASADELCQGRIVFLLEGGYDLQALGESVASTFAGILGMDPIDSLKDPGVLLDEPLDKVKSALTEVQSIHGL